MRWSLVRPPRPPPLRQRRFRFAEERDRRDRWFRRAILALTGVVVAGLLAGTTTGRYAVASAGFLAQSAWLRALGGPVERGPVEARWRARREYGVAVTDGLFRRVYDESEPGLRRLMRYAGMAPGEALLRWGNYDRTLLLPSRVFAPDDAGRSYRLRPNVRSVWLKGVTLPRGLSCFFLVPEAPELPGLLRELGVEAVAGSEQSVNSWGCRGPEPDPGASLRGLVLGDSYMQGLFIGDDETPAACLERILRAARPGSGTVSVLNAGHLGYSPEQYYFTLREYFDRFRPHFVVVGLCDNDFGEDGDWAASDSAYWLEELRQYCTTRGVICVMVPAPAQAQVTGRRRSAEYQGRLSTVSEVSSFELVDPLEDFVDEHLRLTNAAWRAGEPFPSGPLFNTPLHDTHFSAAGARVWGQAVARRLTLLLERAARRAAETRAAGARAAAQRPPGAAGR